MGPLLVETVLAAAPTPPGLAVDEDLVTPGVIGFVVTALLIVAVILLLIEMSRRMRRVRYRAEAQEIIAAELAERDAKTADPAEAQGSAEPQEPADRD